MLTLFALIVGINNYNQSNISNLNGCLQDVEDIERFLEAHCDSFPNVKLRKKSKNIQLQTVSLRDEEATREAVIKGFKLFEDAQDEDICLFYFSGHGCQIDAPKEFWNESDSKLEAIVCHTQKGNDNLLIDKELSFLINKVQKNKEVHFIVITDSCHSGSNTKDPTFKIRSVSPNINSRKVDDYLGRSHYQEIKNEQGEIIRLSSPIGKHFKLSACTHSELAKEKELGINEDSKVRGVFTYSLLEVLKSSGYGLSYLNLISKVRIKARSLTTDQSPQLETIALPPQEKSRIFLNGLLERQESLLKVSYNKDQDRWEINVGSLYGVCEKDIVVFNDEQVSIIEVQTTYAVLNFKSLKNEDQDKIFDAIIIPKFRKKLKIGGFSASNTAETSNKFLLDLLQKSPLIELCNSKDIDYVIRVDDNAIALTHPESYVPIISRTHGQGESQARIFLNLVEKIAEWHHILSIKNPNTKIGESEIEIQFSAVEKPHMTQPSLMDSAPSKLIENWQEENVFRYHFDEKHPQGVWHTPAFRLSIKNNSQRLQFWVSVLYCGGGYTIDETGINYRSTLFSITNRFLEQEKLAPGNIVKLTDKLYSEEYESIPLSLLDDYFDQGYNEIKDTIKIFVSTEEINSSPFNMAGLPIDVEKSMAPRPMGIPSEKFQQSDWRTLEIQVTIVRPRDEGILNVRQSKSFYGVTIVGHPIFCARIILSTMEEFIRSTEVTVDGHKQYMPKPEILYGNENVTLIKFTNGLGDVEGCSVIELYRCEGRNLINEEQPLVFKLDSAISNFDNKPNIILIGYSSEKRTYFTVGTMNKNRQIKIKSLPLESPSLIDGLGNSIKLMLLNVTSEFKIPCLPFDSQTLSIN